MTGRLSLAPPLTPTDHLEDVIDDREVEAYLTTTSALLRLFGLELAQLTPLVPQHLLKKVFQNVIQQALDLVVKDGEVSARGVRIFAVGF